MQATLENNIIPFNKRFQRFITLDPPVGVLKFNYSVELGRVI